MLFYLTENVETMSELNGEAFSRRRHCGFFAGKYRLRERENTHNCNLYPTVIQHLTSSEPFILYYMCCNIVLVRCPSVQLNGQQKICVSGKSLKRKKSWFSTHAPI